jgi:hemolysin activation/secretion protein
MRTFRGTGCVGGTSTDRNSVPEQDILRNALGFTIQGRAMPDAATHRPRSAAARVGRCLAVLLCAALSVPAHARAAGPPGAAGADAMETLPDILPERRGSGAPALPRLGPAPPPAALPARPSRPADEPPPSLPEEALFTLQGVEVTGSTVLDPAVIRQAAAPFLQRRVGLREIEEIRQRVTLLYVDRDYVNSGVVIPDQQVTDGILRLQAVEGRLTTIELTGTRHYRASYLADRLRRGAAVPLNINDLARQQQILLRDPFLRRMNLSLQPGLVPGEARLVGEVTEAPPFALSAQIANNQSPTVGGVRGQLQGVAANLLGIGDILALQYGRSQGIDDGAISYSVPLASDNTRLSLRYDANGTLVVAPELRSLGITSRYDSIGIGLSRPFYQSVEQSFTMGLSLEWRRSRTFLLDEPFSFSAGSVNGRTNVTALRLYQDWLDQNASRVLALRSTFSLGIDTLGATVSPRSPTGRFFAWLGQAQYVRRVFENGELLLRANLQLSNDPLFPIEQFVLGGVSTVRGYREYLTATDNAFTGTVELRIPVGRLPLPILSDAPDAGILQVAPFYDHGVGWNTQRATPSGSDLSSLGLGLRWLIGSGLAAEVYYGRALRAVDAGNTLQDQGLHFRIVAGLF